MTRGISKRQRRPRVRCGVVGFHNWEVFISQGLICSHRLRQGLNTYFHLLLGHHLDILQAPAHCEFLKLLLMQHVDADDEGLTAKSRTAGKYTLSKRGSIASPGQASKLKVLFKLSANYTLYPAAPSDPLILRARGCILALPLPSKPIKRALPSAPGA